MLTYHNMDSGGAVPIEYFSPMIVVVVASSSDRILTLPDFVVGDVGKRLTVLKYGIGKVTLQAYTDVSIQDSGAGDTIYCDDGSMARIELEIIDETQMSIIGGIGNWTTTN